MFANIFKNRFVALSRVANAFRRYSEMSLSEQRLYEKLKNQLSATFVEVHDISGGCGAMFDITVESKLFEGLTKLKQHRIVNELLSEEIKSMHGLQLSTRAPS